MHHNVEITELLLSKQITTVISNLQFCSYKRIRQDISKLNANQCPLQITKCSW